MSVASHYHAHKPNVPIIMEDVFGWVKEGNAFQVRVWLDDSEHDLNVGDDHAFSLLHWASKEGHTSIVEMLLTRGARVNATNMGDDTSLHLAASHGHRQIVQKLISKKADVNPSNEHGMTPLHYACFWGYEQIAEDLIRAGAFVNICNKRNLTPLDVCQPQVRQPIYEIAIENGQNVSQKIPFRDETWRNTKTRTRDATLSRYTGVDIQSLELSKSIAQSHSGTLYRGKWQENEIVARVLNIQDVTARISRDFQTEFPALRIFASPNVCPVLAAVNQPPQLIVISQFMEFGSLYNVLHEQTNVVIDHAQALKFALDIARGMSFLHSLDKMVLRYYLSSKHVVIDSELSAKISMADTKFSFQEVGRLYSPAWMSPEALQRAPEKLNIRAADMWSFGILLFELNTREVPFADLSPMEAGMKIALEGLRVMIPPGIARNMFRLINICLNEDPGRRPAFDQIIPILEKMLG
ncbi:Protein kinase domain-containing protein [Aphelenchoides bicaudatus]|nr:Protein kinase domain-containing protein [Aphelenchoides bicaudatus]